MVNFNANKAKNSNAKKHTTISNKTNSSNAKKHTTISNKTNNSNAKKHTTISNKTNSSNSSKTGALALASLFPSTSTGGMTNAASLTSGVTDPTLSNLHQDLKNNPDLAIIKEMNLIGKSTGKAGSSYTGSSPGCSPTTNFVKEVIEKRRISTMYE